MSDDYPLVTVESRRQWRDWLATHHATSPGIWLVTCKKDAGPHVGYNAIVEEALCFGWVDSRPRTLDGSRSARLLTPRRPGSNWSRLNKERVARLTDAGLMTAAGLAAVAAARRDGTWTALDEVEQLTEPEDLGTALDADPAARGSWDSFPRSVRRAILEWIAAPAPRRLAPGGSPPRSARRRWAGARTSGGSPAPGRP